MSSLDLSGIYPPLPTPYEPNGEISYTQYQENIKKLSNTGLRGFVVLGSNGEAAFLSKEEKLGLLKAAKGAIAPGQLLIAGTGMESVSETIAFTNEAAEIGADVALILTPSYFANFMTHTALVNYFIQVADGIKIPMLIYNVPKFTNVDILPQTVAVLAKHSNIIGLKNSNLNIAHTIECIHVTAEENFSVLVGTASVLYPGLVCGAKGGICALANVAPKQLVAIQCAYNAGNATEALHLQQLMVAPNRAVTAKYGVAGLKAAMDMVGYFGGEPRIPLLPLTDVDRADIEAILKAARILNNQP